MHHQTKNPPKKKGVKHAVKLQHGLWQKQAFCRPISISSELSSICKETDDGASGSLVESLMLGLDQTYYEAMNILMKFLEFVRFVGEGRLASVQTWEVND